MPNYIVKECGSKDCLAEKCTVNHVCFLDKKISSKEPVKDSKAVIADGHSTSESPGAKYDSGKPEYSFIPMSLIELHYKDAVVPDYFWRVFRECHALCNNYKGFVQGEKDTILSLMHRVVEHDGLRHACKALQYGAVKYSRNNWKEGFDGDYKRFLEAAMRHLVGMAEGHEFDYEAIEGFPEGNLHRGAVYFSLMVAYNEACRHFNNHPKWSN